MTGIAVLIMLIAIIIIWGGLAVSVTALVSRGHLPKIGRASCRERV